MSTITLPPRAQSNGIPHVYDHFDPAETEDEKKVIRHSIKSSKADWGFSILRCTYESDEEWATFLKRFRDDLNGDLCFETDEDLRIKLRIPIVEDRELLNGATWDQARTFFMETLQDDSKKRDGNSQHLPDSNSRIGWAKHEIPQSTFFIYADQASVSSVVRCDERKEAKMGNGAYYFTLVWADHTQHGVEGRAMTQEEIEEIDDSPDSEYHQLTRQNFKIYDFVTLYVHIVEDMWPNFVVHDDGISYV
jgi:hypothetical protein